MIWRVDNSKEPSLVGFYRGVRLTMVARRSWDHNKCKDFWNYVILIGKKEVARAVLKRDVVASAKAYVKENF